MAAGKPVISTAIQDVINPYGIEGLVHITHSPEEFIQQAGQELATTDKTTWLAKSDAFLANNSWDNTWQDMMELVNERLAAKQALFANNNHKKREKSDQAFDYLIVGAGFSGSVLAERLASKGNKRILIIDKRDHIGGNTYDYYNNDGILIHKYGPHIFHTNSKDVFEYLGQFTQWRPYEHRVLASVDGQLVPIPINQNTINMLYGLNLSSDEVDAFLKSKAEPIDRILTSEDVVVSKVGRELYEKFFKGYTRKQWALDPSQLDASVTARVPTRTNKDDRYFTDTYQAMPLHGYTALFQRMLAHPNIKIMLNTDYKEVIDLIPHKSLVFTGPIDSFFDYCYGKLPYRSLDFQFETVEAERFQPTGTVNYPNEQLYTRITEFKYLTGQKHPKTSIVYEYPKDEGDPYYPIPTQENARIYKKYQLLAAATPNTYFAGRLGTYKYYNMDQVVAQSLTLFKKLMQAEEQHTLVPVNGHKVSITAP
jgi:UDP-galactopyranose mutase